ncbi:cyclase family protein [Pseudomonas kurunegalensis]|uniref:cyclase family protein n=1 Tax=Pseudomonas kurunegalensis TaxID=485880 RepID=UPI002570870F|nr:cyclase family protein [Pseudomonas kurunegalensis]WJD60693.1 cyclase family protein [Pseudomonas kurunegalensis]
MNFSDIQDYVDLNHVLRSGMVTFPGTSVLDITDHEPRYENGSLVDSLHVLGITSTYIDSPYHVKDGAPKISDYSLKALVNLPIVVIKKPEDRRMFLIEDMGDISVEGKAVLFYTKQDRFFGLPEYNENAPFISTPLAEWLVEHKAALVGIDSILVDDLDNCATTVPVHNLLLNNGVVIAENMTNLSAVVSRVALLTAVPPRVEMSSFPVRIFATIF